MANPRVCILTGYGINSDEELASAFEFAGFESKLVHVNDLIDNPEMLSRYNAFAFPGGFSYGDDTGSGKALANRIRNNLADPFRKFISRDVLVLGICNGFQVMASLGLVPGYSEFGTADIALERNSTDRYQCRWVTLKVNDKSPCVFTKGVSTIRVPVAHGEGNFYAPADLLSRIMESNQHVVRYVKDDGTPANGEFPFNPNGALYDIAGICDATGRIFALMPHPERNILFTNRDDWTLEREKMRRGKGATLAPQSPDNITLQKSEGMIFFENARKYFE